MSLGNVSYARTNEAYFRQALRYLRSTGRIPDYELPQHLQRYVTLCYWLSAETLLTEFVDILTITDVFFLDANHLRSSSTFGRKCEEENLATSPLGNTALAHENILLS